VHARTSAMSGPHRLFGPHRTLWPASVLKTLGTQITTLLTERETRKSLLPFFQYLIFLLGVIVLFAVMFHWIMWNVEGQQHSWFSGFYWTLVTMSTLGFGDIVFQTDLGRAFSVFVILSGVVLLLIVLPYLFLNQVAVPWLQASLRLQAPRSIPLAMRDHVIVAGSDALAHGLVQRLERQGIQTLMLESDPERAATRAANGESVLTGDPDSRETWEQAGVERARLIVADLDDVANTNLILTARDVNDRIPIVAVANEDDAVDVMELAGATHVLPLRRQLGEQLAARLNAGHAETHQIGRVGDLIVAEFPVHNTPLVGKSIRETRLRERLGVSVVGVWEQARLNAVRPDEPLQDQSIPVVVGTAEQIEILNELLYIYDTNWNPVLVIGGGKVGLAATEALRRRGVPVHLLEKHPETAAKLHAAADRVIAGDAANREILEEAGIMEAPAVLITTNDDATNVYLTVYCRKINPELRIVSRVTRTRNIDSMRRAGADLVLSYDTLGIETVTAVALKRPLVLLGEGVELCEFPIPKALQGQTLVESGIGANTGLAVIGFELDGSITPVPGAQARVPEEGKLILMGSSEGVEAFRRIYPDP
jgi:voltage-gated potassium channel